MLGIVRSSHHDTNGLPIETLTSKGGEDAYPEHNGVKDAPPKCYTRYVEYMNENVGKISLQRPEPSSPILEPQMGCFGVPISKLPDEVYGKGRHERIALVVLRG